VRMNDSGSDLTFLAPKPKKRSRRKATSTPAGSDAAVGGGAGPQH